jgi:hypothetical protein
MQSRSVRRRLQFEALEKRVTMSSGLAHPSAVLVATRLDHTVDAVKNQHVLAVITRAFSVSESAPNRSAAVAAGQPAQLTASLSGGSSTLLAGNLVLIGGLSGKIGKVLFHATANGVVSGKSFLDGTIHFTNSQGTISASLGHGTLIVQSGGKSAALKNLVLIVQQATGKYSPVAGVAGNLTFTFTHTTSKAQARPQIGYDPTGLWVWPSIKMRSGIDSGIRRFLKLFGE